jgi:hypothetical protein
MDRSQAGGGEAMKLAQRLMLLMLIILLGSAMFSIADPTGATIVSNTSQTPTSASAGTVTTAGGSFTTLILNATMQTPRWKAYVGNASGRFSLQDATNMSIYDWDLAAVSGEVYASRNNSITWSSIRCAVNATVATEQVQLNITTTKEDSINRTFNNTVHRGFYVGTTLIANSTCRAIATYVNNSRQAAAENASFQEILLDDTQRLVYVTLLEQDRQGYNNAPFDFQMIVAESEFNPSPSPYYFWVELS